MRNPNALDTTIRWLVLTGAAVMVFVLVPSSALGGEEVLYLSGLGSLHAVHVIALGVVVLAWFQCTVHLARLRPPLKGDPWAVGLAGAAALAVVATVAVVVGGPPEAVPFTLTPMVVLKLLFAVRVDRRARQSARTTASAAAASAGWLRGTRRAP